MTNAEGDQRDGDRLRPSQLYTSCDLGNLGFETTADLGPPDSVVGQERASRALDFGTSIEKAGFNVFALGPEETNKRAIVRQFLDGKAGGEAPPLDLCYVNDFETPHRPKALRLPPGRGRPLAHQMDEVLTALPSTLQAAFEGEEYQARRQAAAESANEEQEAAFEALQARAKEEGLALLRTPGGFVFAPIRDGEVRSPSELEELPEEEQERIQERIRELQGELQQILRRVPRQQREMRHRIQELDREVAGITVRDLLEDVRTAHADLPEVRAFLDRVQEDVVENVRGIVEAESHEGGTGGQDSASAGMPTPLEHPRLRRYRVNVLVDHGDSEHAPVVYEDHPTYQNLVGRVEYASVMGTLVTDFNLIKAGALHRANGGYLILDAHRVLSEPLAWEGLKRTLQAGELRIESPQEAAGLVRTVTLEPEPLPLTVKVVLLGTASVYHLLSQLDPDFRNLFKVAADFDDRLHRGSEEERVYAHLIADVVREEGLRPLDRSAVERIVEWSARQAGDAERLSARTVSLADLLREVDHWCAAGGAEVATGEHVHEALRAREDRSGRVRDRVWEEILRETHVVETSGERVGQVNGLSVLQLPGLAFGQPNRITSRIRMGRGEVLNIEREVAMSGPIHSKGVLILSSFLGARYASDHPLSLSASLVFEQSYGGIDGDSASLAELLTLLSAIGEVPLRQSFAITGSVDQHGRVQAVGGVNEKIEGFFRVCEARGLDGTQGVLLPAANRKHLMLDRDVVRAVEEDRFHVYGVETVERAMEIVSGTPMGERDTDGRYPVGTVNHRVAGRLRELAQRRREFFSADGGEEG